MLNRKIRKAIGVPMEFVTLLLFYYLFFSVIYKSRRRENIIGLGHRWFNENIKYLYRELEEHDCIKVYFVTGNKAELERLKSSNVKVYYSRDPRNAPLFLRTKIWVTSSGHSYIPFAYAQIILRRFFGIRVNKWVDVWHGGIGFKHVGREEQLADYDLGFVTSQFFLQYYSKRTGISKKLRITGNPRMDSLIKKDFSREEVLEGIGVPRNRKNIFYAPTRAHENEKPFFPWERTEKIVNDLQRFCDKNNCNFLVRMHPWHYATNREKMKKLDEKINQSKNMFVLSPEKHVDVQGILYVSDVLVTDWSGIANDFIVLNRPIIFLDVELPVQEFKLTPEDRVGYIAKGKNEFFEKLHEAIDHPKLFKEKFGEKRKALIGKCYKYLDGNSSRRCAEEIIKLFK